MPSVKSEMQSKVFPKTRRVVHLQKWILKCPQLDLEGPLKEELLPSIHGDHEAALRDQLRDQHRQQRTTTKNTEQKAEHKTGGSREHDTLQLLCSPPGPTAQKTRGSRLPQTYQSRPPSPQAWPANSSGGQAQCPGYLAVVEELSVKLARTISKSRALNGEELRTSSQFNPQQN